MHGAAIADDSTVLKNWFGDPFLQLVAEMPGCPTPRGPLLTEAEMKAETHSRVERGTSCWMAGECAQPNAYLYDAAIADALRQRIGAQALRGSSVWLTVKRRFVWVEGCLAEPGQVKNIEAAVKQVPDIDRVFLDLMQGTKGKPPYRTLPQSSDK